MASLTSYGYHRPRRPANETITYLRGLPFDAVVAHEEVARFLRSVDGCNEDFPQTLAAAFVALDEIKSEVASIAGDEFGSQSLEILARIAIPYSEIAARIFLHACSGYFLHLATHRYGSHVLQTILQLSMSAMSERDLSLLGDAPPSLRDAIEKHKGGHFPSLYELIVGVVDELSPHTSDLVVHLCGSHVLRTLLCVTGGVNFVSEKDPRKLNERFGACFRGRPKPKKKKKRKISAMDETTSSMASNCAIKVVHLLNPRLDPASFNSTLELLTYSLIGSKNDKPGELQQLACHASAGPLFIVLVRVLAHSSLSVRQEYLKRRTLNSDETDINAIDDATNTDSRLGICSAESRYEEGSLADSVVKQLLCWKTESQDQPYARDVIYGLSGEVCGSHLLETIFALSYDEFYVSLIQIGDFLSPTSMQEYVTHDVSNFVIQSLIATTRSKEQAEVVLKVVEKVISNGLAIDSKKKRRGILWRATELAAKYRVEQEGLLKAVRLGFVCINDLKDASRYDKAELGSELDANKKKKRKKATAVELSDCISSLIALKVGTAPDYRITVDVAGSRSVYHMLRFSPRLCKDILRGIIENMSAEELAAIARDGLASKCILDAILDGPVAHPLFLEAVKELRKKLSGHWTSLSLDRVGHHTVKKLFIALPKIDEKLKLVEELESSGNRLRGNAMGRAVIAACDLDTFRQNRKEWTIVNKYTKNDISVSDAVEFSTAGSDTGHDTLSSKRKRRRRKKIVDPINDENNDDSPKNL